MTETATATASTTRVLVVDDNRIYREAFRRNLMLNGYEVIEAEDTDEALTKLQAEPQPQVVVTDLQMRTETEGIDLIKAIKSVDPLLPVIMISAVGTFEEGALAQKHGATAVISKSRIEDEIERLYTVIDSARIELDKSRRQAEIVDAARNHLSEAAPENGDSDNDVGAAKLLEQLNALLATRDIHPYLRSEAGVLAAQLNDQALRREAAAAAVTAAAAANQAVPPSAETPETKTPASEQRFLPLNLEAVEAQLRRELPDYDNFEEDSKESLRIAEFLYEQQARIPGSIDFSRNIGFSYCFAVENEAKRRMAKRLQKFLSDPMTYVLLAELMEKGNQNLSVYYHQHLLLLLRGKEMDFTVDNVKQTFRRILEHQGRYKPDGLKALGIMILAFGRNYPFSKEKRTIRIANPLGIRGLDAEKETLEFAELLISLQHYRNPYIHPEISDMEKLSKIRATTMECLRMSSRLQ